MDGDALQYTKVCRDFSHVGVTCCLPCHSDPEYHMDVVQVDGEPALLCCSFRKFFYPNGIDSKLSPEERLLRAIFGEPHHNRDANEEFD